MAPSRGFVPCRARVMRRQETRFARAERLPTSVTQPIYDSDTNGIRFVDVPQPRERPTALEIETAAAAAAAGLAAGADAAARDAAEQGAGADAQDGEFHPRSSSATMSPTAMARPAPGNRLMAQTPVMQTAVASSSRQAGPSLQRQARWRYSRASTTGRTIRWWMSAPTNGVRCGSSTGACAPCGSGGGGWRSSPSS